MIQLIVFNLFLVMCIQLLKLCIKINYVFDFLDNEEKEKYYKYVKNKYKILNNVDDNIFKKIFIYPSFIIYLLDFGLNSGIISLSMGLIPFLFKIIINVSIIIRN